MTRIYLELNKSDCFDSRSLRVPLFQGGSVIRLFHKDLEAYLVAEGVYGEEPMENGNEMYYTSTYPPELMQGGCDCSHCQDVEVITLNKAEF